MGINSPSEKRLLIDISVIRHPYEIREIAEIVWIPMEANRADLQNKMDSKNDHLIYQITEQNRTTVQDSSFVHRKTSKKVYSKHQLIADFQSLKDFND